jgi:hypothetical protein
MTVFCSYTDAVYLPRLLVLLDSLKLTLTEDKVFVLALDSETQAYFETNPGSGVECLALEDLENHSPELLNAKADRTAMEYVFTLTPFLIKFLLLRTRRNEVVAYLDADLFFFGLPSTVTDAMEGMDVGIIPHSYSNFNANLASKYGTFNVGWVGIRNSLEGVECVEWWASQCLNWCGDEPIDGKYADQGYLDQFPLLFGGVKILKNRGFNLAPWNTSGQVISLDSEGDVFLGDHTPLTFFHFHGLKRFGNWMITSQLNYRSPASKSLMELVYEPYLRELWKAEKSLENKSLGRPARKLVRGKGLRKLARNLSSKLLMVASAITGNAVHMSRLK